MKKKILNSILFSVICLGIGCLNVNASTDDRIVFYNNEEVPFSSIKLELCPSTVGKVIFENPISVNGVNIELLCTFEDRDAASEELIAKYVEGFSYLYNNYDLPDSITPENWTDFLYAINDSYAKIDNTNNNLYYELSVISAFFDTYENTEVNDEIKNLAKQSYYSPIARSTIIPYDVQNRIDTLIPDYSPNFGTITPILSNRTRAYGYDINRAIDYAKTYAVTPNTYEYRDFGTRGDCTNFASQVLEYAGVKQDVYNSVYSGWWHKKNGNIHTNSNTWSVAGDFARYMGVTYYTTNLYDWSKKIQAGDIIGLDENNDGTYNHIGIVTGKRNTLNTYTFNKGDVCGMVNYYDFEVAQHTNNYLAWASTETNNWEKKVDNGARFAIIRG